MRAVDLLLVIVSATCAMSYAMGTRDEITYMYPQQAEEYYSKNIKAYYTPNPILPYQQLFCAHAHQHAHDRVEHNSSEHYNHMLPSSVELFYVLKAHKVLQDLPALKQLACLYKDKYVWAYTRGDTIAIYINDVRWARSTFFNVWNLHTCKKAKLDIEAARIVWLKFAVEHLFQSRPDIHFHEKINGHKLASYAIYDIVRRRRQFTPLTQKHVDHLIIIADKKNRRSKKGVG